MRSITRGRSRTEASPSAGGLSWVAMENAHGLLTVMAHPDDESMGCGGLILRHSRAGVPVNLICATRGEAGWMGKPRGAVETDLPQIRAGELEEAAAALAIGGVAVLVYPGGGVRTADPPELSPRISGQNSKHDHT